LIPKMRGFFAALRMTWPNDFFRSLLENEGMQLGKQPGPDGRKNAKSGRCRSIDPDNQS
jgi:hypothetical protein